MQDLPVPGSRDDTQDVEIYDVDLGRRAKAQGNEFDEAGVVPAGRPVVCCVTCKVVSWLANPATPAVNKGVRHIESAPES